MDDIPPRRQPLRIEAAGLDRVDVTDNGQRLCLRMHDAAGRAASVSIPVTALNALLTALPRTAPEVLAGPAAEVHALDSWTLGHGPNGLTLTFHLPDGVAISFAVKPWQLAAMASLADVAPAAPRTGLH